MTVKEGKELIIKLEEEINQGIDIELNRQWIRHIKKSIVEASVKAFKKALNNLNQ